MSPRVRRALAVGFVVVAVLSAGSVWGYARLDGVFSAFDRGVVVGFFTWSVHLREVCAAVVLLLLLGAVALVLGHRRAAGGFAALLAAASAAAFLATPIPLRGDTFALVIDSADPPLDSFLVAAVVACATAVGALLLAARTWRMQPSGGSSRQ